MNTSPGRPDALFADAQQALAAGNPAAALSSLDRLPPSYASHPDILHVRALALKQAGRLDDAQAAFAGAQRADPGNPHILNNHANLLLQQGRLAEALPLYDAALRLMPSYRDAAFNRALCLQGLGRLPDALAAIDRLLTQGPGEPRLHSARGAILLGLGRMDDAALAFDTALAAGQPLPKALIGRARVALERGESSAVGRFRDAHRVTGDDPVIVLGLADALEADGDPEGIAILADAVARHPDWIEGLERLAQMRAEAGDEAFADHYQPALSNAADPAPVRLSLARMLSAADLHAEAAATLAPLGDGDGIRILRAYYLGEAGDAGAALALITGTEGADAALIAARLAITSGDFGRADAALDGALADAPHSIAAWAHRELLWRVTGDDRAAWLSGQDGLVATRSLGLSGDEIAAVAALLRTLHRTRAFPIGQSLRGGTQTRGRLLLRQEPELRQLREALDAAIGDHVQSLPAVDPAHPLLKYRNQPFDIAGSWSVRLTAQGFHVSHIHPEGVLSSACYFNLPDGIADDPERAGWLEIGRPPPALRLALGPLAVIAPAPGRLVLFPSYLYHGTRPFASGERLSVAFDVVAA